MTAAVHRQCCVAAVLLAVMSMSEGGVGISRPRVVELKQMLSEFQTGQLKTIANDLKATGGSNLAENLKEVQTLRSLASSHIPRQPLFPCSLVHTRGILEPF